MPSSARRIAANRANAQKSTGPTSLSGKARAALNAFKHGLATNRIIVQGEEAAEFEQMRTSMLEHYQPLGPEQNSLFDDMFSSFWRMRRAQHLEQALFGIVMTQQERWMRSWTEIDLHKNKNQDQDEGAGSRDNGLKVDLDQGLNRAAKAFKGESAVFQTLSQYEARLSRQYLRYRKELRALQAQDQSRAANTKANAGARTEVQTPPPAERVGSTGCQPVSVPNTAANSNKKEKIRVIGFVPPKTCNMVPNVTPKVTQDQPKPGRGRR